MEYQTTMVLLLGFIACVIVPLTIYVLQIRDVLVNLIKKEL